MRQKVKTLKRKEDHHLHDEIYVDSDFTPGQEITLQYYLHRKISPRDRYISAFEPDDQTVIGRFMVQALFANMLTAPPCVMLELKALDPQFFLRYPVERIMLLSEAEVYANLHTGNALDAK